MAPVRSGSLIAEHENPGGSPKLQWMGQRAKILELRGILLGSGAKSIVDTITTARAREQVRFVQNVGLDARETNNLVERLHGTLKDRLKPMRGLKSEERSKALLDGFVVHYNFIRPHQSLDNKIPAEAAGLKKESGNWKDLIKKAYQYKNVGNRS